MPRRLTPWVNTLKQRNYNLNRKQKKGKDIKRKKIVQDPKFRGQNLWSWFLNNLSTEQWLNKFCGYSPKELEHIFNIAKDYIAVDNRYQDSEQIHFKRNKFLLFVDFLKNRQPLNHSDRRVIWGVTYPSAKRYVDEVATAIIMAFERRKTSIVDVPSIEIQKILVEILRLQGKPVSLGCLCIDASHIATRGRYLIYHSWKTKASAWHITFVIERVNETIVAFYTNPNTLQVSDIKAWYDMLLYKNLRQKLGPPAEACVILADGGYEKGNDQYLAAPPADDERRIRCRVNDIASRHMIKMQADGRRAVERTFAIFFTGKFWKLGNWCGAGPFAFDEWKHCVRAAVCIYNELRTHQLWQKLINNEQQMDPVDDLDELGFRMLNVDRKYERMCRQYFPECP